MSIVNQTNIVKHSRKSKAPYTKAERIERRKEVFRLHLELGYPGSEIANLMKRDPNTIYSDIKAILKRLYKESNLSFDSEDWFIKQLTRLELERGKLVKLQELHKDDFDKVITVKKLILDIDTKISNLVIRTRDVKEDTEKFMAQVFNQLIEDYNKKENRKSSIYGGTANTFDMQFKNKKFKLITE